MLDYVCEISLGPIPALGDRVRRQKELGVRELVLKQQAALHGDSEEEEKEKEKEKEPFIDGGEGEGLGGEGADCRCN